MQKFVALISTPSATMEQWMSSTTEEERASQMETMMKDWNAWMETHRANLVDDGLPLGKTKKVMKDGITDSKNDLNYMMIIQADSHEAAAELFSDNPHLRDIPGSYVEVMGTRGPSAS